MHAIRGHLFMMSTQRGRGSGLCGPCECGEGSAPFGCPYKKLEPTA